jgi:hypothetical protein
MATTLPQLVEEAKDFFRLNRKYKQQNNPDAGTVAFLVSRKWLVAYKKFLCYKEIKSNSKPEIEENHF